MAPLFGIGCKGADESAPVVFLLRRPSDRRPLGLLAPAARSRRLVLSSQNSTLASGNSVFSALDRFDDDCDQCADGDRIAFRTAGAAAYPAAYVAACVVDPLSELAAESDDEVASLPRLPWQRQRVVDEHPPPMGNFSAATLDSLPDIFQPLSQETLPSLHAAGPNTVDSLPPWADKKGEDEGEGEDEDAEE